MEKENFLCINGQKIKLTKSQITKMRNSFAENDNEIEINPPKIISNEIFKIGKYEFIKFVDEDGNIIGVLANKFCSMMFGGTNDFSESYILSRLNEKFLPEIEKAIGAENLLEFETDLISLCGITKYGTIKSKVSIPTFDFYRNNRYIFDKYNIITRNWWLATPDRDGEACCVTPEGYITSSFCREDYGTSAVRPMIKIYRFVFEDLTKSEK